MGDRATIQFADQAASTSAVTVQANIYTHWSGSEVPEVLEAFFEHQDGRIESGEQDSRFGDASYLAVRFLTFVSDSTGRGWGIVPATERETRNYLVTCTGREVRPSVTEIEN